MNAADFMCPHARQAIVKDEGLPSSPPVVLTFMPCADPGCHAGVSGGDMLFKMAVYLRVATPRGYRWRLREAP